MKGLRLALVLGAALAGGTASIAQAVPVTPLGPEAGNAGLLQNVQFFFGGRRFCWYWDGWHGPGWYWCGYAFRRGLGWGGPRGFRGWGVPARGPGFRPGRPGRPAGMRPGRAGGPGPMARPGGGPGRGGPGRAAGGGGRPGGGGGRPGGGGGGRGGGGGGRGGGGGGHGGGGRGGRH
jgi:hypothetical protein